MPIFDDGKLLVKGRKLQPLHHRVSSKSTQRSSSEKTCNSIMPHLVFSFVKLQAVLSSDKVAVAKNVQGFQTKFFKAF